MKKIKKIKLNENQENDGFWSSDGEFDKEAEKIIQRERERERREDRRVARLRNQVTELKEEKKELIRTKDEVIKDLENQILKLQKGVSEELEEQLMLVKKELKEKDEMLEKARDEITELADDLNTTEEKLLKYVKVGDGLKVKLQDTDKKMKLSQSENKRLRKELNECKDELNVRDGIATKLEETDQKLKLTQFENTRLRKELSECKDELATYKLDNDHGHDSQEQSQAVYSHLVRNSTENFNNKHVVSPYRADVRHQYTKKFEFWNFDDGPLEITISNFDHFNFQGKKSSYHINYAIINYFDCNY